MSPVAAGTATGPGLRAGQGQMVDVALYEAVFNMMESMVPEFDFAGVVRERTGGALPGIVPSNTYTTGDGMNIVIAGNGDAIFKRLMRPSAATTWPMIPAWRATTAAYPVPKRSTPPSSNGAARRPSTALATLQAADVPVGKIYSVKDMMSDAQFLARDMFEQHQFADGTPVKLPGITPKMSETPGQTKWLGPSWAPTAMKSCNRWGMMGPTSRSCGTTAWSEAIPQRGFCTGSSSAYRMLYMKQHTKQHIIST
jgi:formyl-CoA transferase